ncbi:MAG: hypothetical protein AAGF19_00445 [Pseudomonadota bacterium]
MLDAPIDVSRADGDAAATAANPLLRQATKPQPTDEMNDDFGPSAEALSQQMLGDCVIGIARQADEDARSVWAAIKPLCLAHQFCLIAVDPARPAENTHSGCWLGGLQHVGPAQRFSEQTADLLAALEATGRQAQLLRAHRNEPAPDDRVSAWEAGPMHCWA